MQRGTQATWRGDNPTGRCYPPHSPQPDPWCSGPTCQPVTLEIAGSNPVGSAIQHRIFLRPVRPPGRGVLLSRGMVVGCRAWTTRRALDPALLAHGARTPARCGARVRLRLIAHARRSQSAPLSAVDGCRGWTTLAALDRCAARSRACQPARCGARVRLASLAHARRSQMASGVYSRNTSPARKRSRRRPRQTVTRERPWTCQLPPRPTTAVSSSIPRTTSPRGAWKTSSAASASGNAS
jgi:hypothetical protein